MKVRLIKLCVAASLALVMLVAGASIAFASGPALHFSEDVTGDQFVCEGATYTTVSGVIDIVVHEGESASGNQNFTVTITPKNLLLVDGNGGEFTIRGAVWFGGTFNNQNGVERGEFTAYINILAKRGGVADKVAITAVFSSDGKEFFFDKGTCAF